MILFLLLCEAVLTSTHNLWFWSKNKKNSYTPMLYKSGVQARGGGGTLKFSVYIGEADFFGVKILNFRIFLGFSEKLVIFLGL